MLITTIIALIIFFVFYWYIISRKGNLAFWKEVKKNSYKALEFFKSNYSWYVFENGLPKDFLKYVPKSEWDGPFRINITDPYLSKVYVFGRIGEYETTQKEILKNGFENVASEKDKSIVDSIVFSIIRLCYLSENWEKQIDNLLEKESELFINEIEKQNFKNALRCFSLSAAIITLRNRYQEKIEPIIKKIYDEIFFTIGEDLGKDVSEFVVSLIKFYTTHWKYQIESAQTPTDLSFKFIEMFIEPLKDFFSNYNRIVKSTRISLFLSYFMIDSAKNVNVVMDNAKRQYNFEPSFED